MRKLSNSKEDETGGFLRRLEKKISGPVANDTPMRVVSQQQIKMRGLLENLVTGDNNSSGGESSQNAIEKLNLLEEDGEDSDC